MATKKQKKITKIVYPKSFSSEKYPEFIRKSIFLKAYPKPVKAFPKLGLKNCDVSLGSVKLTGEHLWLQQLAAFRDAIDVIALTQRTLRYTNELKHFDEERNELWGRLCNDICDAKCDIIRFDLIDNYCVDGKLILPENRWVFTGLGKTVKLPKNPPISLLAKEIVKFCKARHIKCSKLEKLSFKEKCSAADIVPWKNKENLRICFSSENEKGYWDIATMSMRKISSCMRWSSHHSKSLVGSILDPYAGIIYITDGTNTKYGKTMLARAVVRFVVRGHNNEPHIMIEKVYPENDNSNVVEGIFQSFIQARVDLPVVIANADNYDDSVYGAYHIPTTEQVDSLLEIDGDYDGLLEGYLTYRDSGIDYAEVRKFYDPSKVKSYART